MTTNDAIPLPLRDALEEEFARFIVIGELASTGKPVWAARGNLLELQLLSAAASADLQQALSHLVKAPDSPALHHLLKTLKDAGELASLAVKETAQAHLRTAKGK